MFSQVSVILSRGVPVTITNDALDLTVQPPPPEIRPGTPPKFNMLNKSICFINEVSFLRGDLVCNLEGVSY